LKSDQFATLSPNVAANEALRIPQQKAYEAIADHYSGTGADREIGLVLPVGCGKSGLLAIAPFAVASTRALLVAPNLNIADQLLKDLTPSHPKFFYEKRGVLLAPPYPEPAEIRGKSSNLDDLESADIVITNIQQLQRAGNTWLAALDADFFDLIMFDEAHHNVAESWEALREKFPAAKIINVSGTPSRADGRLMAGQIIYSYPIREAVEQGYVKRITGHRLNPESLRYVRREDDVEIEIGLDEVRRLGEEDAGFRRSIVSSDETLSTIVDASIRKLRELRERSGEGRLKIIASALNMEHCKQVVAKYAERGLRADFVHSKQDGKANEQVHAKLERHELDVIVQVRKLGEGFDHPFLTVAAVFSIFSSLSPFVQFVGRVMRIIPDVDPFDQVNEGVVVFHVGANITGVWKDFQEFAEADQEWLAQLIDEHIDDGTQGEDIAPLGGTRPPPPNEPTVTGQGTVLLEDLQLLSGDPRVAQALKLLQEAGVQTGDQFDQLQRIQPTKQDRRRSKKKLLDERSKTKVGKILASRKLPHGGRELDRKRLGKDNFQVLKSAIDKAINADAGYGANARDKFTNDQLDSALLRLDEVADAVEKATFDVK
jgi:superfamily II DNA or RNA helicase